MPTAMTKASFIREAHLLRLQQNIGVNSKRYKETTPWVDKYFGADNWRLESHIEIPENIQLREPDSANLAEHDLENVKIIYSALKHLTPLQAADVRFWAYLTHVSHYKYMRARWPTERYIGNARFDENIRERYFFMGNKSRALVRNGLARLWWCGHGTYDATRDDHFELTSILLKTDEVRQTLQERAFSHNVLVMKTVLSVLADLEKAGKPFYEREALRELAKYLVQVGGVTILDALDAADIIFLAGSKISHLTPTPVSATSAQ